MFKRGVVQEWSPTEGGIDDLLCDLSHQVEIIENASIIVGVDGKILAVGSSEDIEKNFLGATFQTTIGATGKCVLPGFVDSHTHPVWCGDRCHEFAMKLAGL